MVDFYSKTVTLWYAAGYVYNDDQDNGSWERVSRFCVSGEEGEDLDGIALSKAHNDTPHDQRLVTVHRIGPNLVLRGE